MKNNLINNSDSLIEKKIDWKTVRNEMKKKFGTDIFESWLKKIDLVDEFNSYILIAVPTRFIRDWIASRYLDQILSIVKTYKKEIIRIEFVINNDNNRLIDKVALEDNLSKSIESNVCITIYFTGSIEDFDEYISKKRQEADLIKNAFKKKLVKTYLKFHSICIFVKTALMYNYCIL